MAWYLSCIIEQLTDSADIISSITNPVIVPTRSNYRGEEVHRWFKLQFASVFCKARDALFTTENSELELLKDKEMQHSFFRSLSIGVVLLLDLIFQRSRACFSWNNPVALPDLYFCLSLWPVAPIAKGVGVLFVLLYLLFHCCILQSQAVCGEIQGLRRCEGKQEN